MRDIIKYVDMKIRFLDRQIQWSKKKKKKKKKEKEKKNKKEI